MKKSLFLVALLFVLVAVALADGAYTLIVKNRLIVNGNFIVATQNLASATTLTLPEYGADFNITGTAKCTRILPGSGSYDGRTVRLFHAGADTLVDGVNLKLAGDFNGTADDYIVLVQRDTFFVEVSRSAN